MEARALKITQEVRAFALKKVMWFYGDKYVQVTALSITIRASPRGRVTLS